MAAKGMRLVRRTSYAQDLDRIVDHLAEDNPSAPFDMWDEIERQVQPLRDFPHSGRAGRIPKTRELVVTGTPFVVIYMVGENVEVIRVLHGAQKWPAAE